MLVNYVCREWSFIEKGLEQALAVFELAVCSLDFLILRVAANPFVERNCQYRANYQGRAYEDAHQHLHGGNRLRAC